ncbi:MAG: response regulator [Ginsengibacter sp.]
MPSFLLVDDNPLVCSVLKFLVKEKFSRCQVDEPENLQAALEKIRKKNYSLVMIDVHVTDADAIELANSLLEVRRDVKILMYGISHTTSLAHKYLELGIMGCLAKDEEEDEIQKAIESVLNNGKYISPKLFYGLTGEYSAKF